MAEFSHFKGCPGQIADTAFKDVLSYPVDKKSAPIPFGTVVTEKGGFATLGGDGRVVGVAVKSDTQPLGSYTPQTCVGVMQMGRIWAVAKEKLKATDPVSFDPATGLIAKSGTAIANARFTEDSGAGPDGLIVVQIDFHATTTAAAAPTPPPPPVP